MLASNTLLRPVVNRINRTPVQEELSEASYTVYLVCARERQAALRALLVEQLEAANYPVRDIEQHAFGDSAAEVEAKLYATSVDAQELDRLMLLLGRQPGVQQVFWSASAEE